MLLQLVCCGGCVFALVTFMWPFSSMSHHMSPRVGISCCYIVAFFAFETVCHHVFHQIYFIRGFKITLVAFVDVLLLVCYQVNLQSTLKGKYILTLVTLKEFLFAFFFPCFLGLFGLICGTERTYHILDRGIISANFSILFAHFKITRVKNNGPALF